MGDSESKQFGEQYLGKLSDQLDQKAPVFGKSLFTGAGDATKNAWRQGTSFANGLNASGGLTDPMRSAMTSFGDIGTGFGAAGDAARSSFSPLYGGYGAAADASDAALSPVAAGYGAFGANGGLNGAQTGAMSDLGAIGSGYGGLYDAYSAGAPGATRMRDKLRDDTATGIYNDFNNSGLFGSDANLSSAGEGIADALAGFDLSMYDRDVNNQYRSLDSQRGIAGDTFGMAQTGRSNELAGLTGQGSTAQQMFGNRMAGLAGQGDVTSAIFGTDTAALNGQQGAASSLFNSGQQGLTNQQGAIDALSTIGASKDANQQGRRLGRADLFDRKNNAELDRLLKIGAGFGGAATDAANEPPWWQQLLGYAVGNAGKAASAWGGGA